MDQQHTSVQPTKRIYIGNLPYHAQAKDVETYLEQASFVIEHLDMAIDPSTGRNPSYCFAEFFSVEEAQRALSLLPGASFMGRPLKASVDASRNRGANKSTPNGRSQKTPFTAPDSTWRAQPSANGASKDGDREPYTFNRWERKDTDSHRTAPVENGHRLYVGSLPKIEGQETINEEMKTLFKNYTVESVSKLIPPHESTSSLPGDHYYCFVDFASTEEAQAAANTLNGTSTPWGGNFKINMARDRSNKRLVREQQPSDKPAPVRDFGSSWRRAG